MPFLSRTTRESNKVGFTKPQTSNNVGPGSYNPPSSFKSNKPSFTPFSTSSRRDGLTSSMVTPGPGSYNPVLSKKCVLGAAGGNFRSKTTRFETKSYTDVPGPGEYNITSKWNKYDFNLLQ